MSSVLKRYDILLSVVLFLLVIPAERLGVFAAIEDEIHGYWHLLRWNRAPPTQTTFRGDSIVMVTTDDAFYEAYGAYPLRRFDYGVLARNLGQLGARVVVIVAGMDQPSPTGDDDATARMYAQTRDVLLASIVDVDVLGRTALDITYPVATLRGSTHSGYVERVTRTRAMRVRVYEEMVGRRDGWPLSVKAFALYRDVEPSVENATLVVGELATPLEHGTDFHVDYPRISGNTRFLSDTYAIPAMQILKLREQLPDDVVKLTFEIRDKIVLVGDISEMTGDAFDVPAGRVYGVEMIAAAIHTLLNGVPLAAAPIWVKGLVSLAFLMLIVGTAWVRRNLARLLLTLLIFAAYLTAVALAYAELGVILAVSGNVLAGILGAALISLRMRLAAPSTGARRQGRPFERMRLAALALQGQGKLDQAFEKFREMPLNDISADLIYNLGLDFERKRLFTRAGAVYGHLAQWDEDFKDVAARVAKAARVEADPLKAARSLGATMAPAGSALQVSSFGRFKVVEELGEKAMGTVYRALDPETNRSVVIETMSLSRTFGGDALEEGRARFLHEARSAGRLDHPNIVAIYDSGQEDDLAFIAMEHIEGHDLSRYTLKGNLLPLDVILSVIAQCAEALDYAHGEGVAHRDIEPSNIIFEPKSGKAKVTDFGVAHVADTGVRSSVRGKPNYMSPEEAQGGQADGRSDLFSIGVVLYQLACGELPFQGDSMASLRYKIVNDEPPDIMKIDPRVPPTLRKVLDNALRKDPKRRYPNGAKLADHLRLCRQRLASARKTA
jgi:serine/threonine-protein kinase